LFAAGRFGIAGGCAGVARLNKNENKLVVTFKKCLAIK
jgi:hypothetical protein